MRGTQNFCSLVPFSGARRPVIGKWLTRGPWRQGVEGMRLAHDKVAAGKRQERRTSGVGFGSIGATTEVRRVGPDDHDRFNCVDFAVGERRSRDESRRRRRSVLWAHSWAVGKGLA
jgi:hypothetical protein